MLVFFLGTFQEKKKTTEGYFHYENFRSVVSNLFAAGMETTSNTLHWAILLMMKFPEIQSMFHFIAFYSISYSLDSDASGKEIKYPFQ